MEEILSKGYSNAKVSVQGFSRKDGEWREYTELFDERAKEILGWMNNHNVIRFVASISRNLKDEVFSLTGKKYGDYDGRVFYEKGDIPKEKMLKCHHCGKDCNESESLVGLWGCAEDLDPLDHAYCPDCINQISSGRKGYGENEDGEESPIKLGKCDGCGWITSDDPENMYWLKTRYSDHLCTECHEKEESLQNKVSNKMTNDELDFEISRLERGLERRTGKHLRSGKMQKAVAPKKNHRNRKNIVG